MQFTYNAYQMLLSLLAGHGYICTDYHRWKHFSRCVILRHDIDADISRAMVFAEMEAQAHCKATYFVLLRNDEYNPLSRSSVDKLKRIMGFGHEIGLHFDEMSYPEAVGDKEKITALICSEANMLENEIGCPITCVSMHRPSQEILEADLDIPGMVNSYGQTFFHTFKYLSDSRRHWHEPVEDVIRSEKYDRIQLLTHPFWYHKKELDMKDSLKDFINRANYERYLMLRDNFTNMDEVFTVNDVDGIKASGETA